LTDKRAKPGKSRQNNGCADLELFSRHLHPSRAMNPRNPAINPGFLAVFRTAAYNLGDDGDDRWLVPAFARLLQRAELLDGRDRHVSGQ
jgi:hypothetical protein